MADRGKGKLEVCKSSQHMAEKGTERRLLNKKLIIFDINGVLVHAIHIRELENTKLARDPDITNTKKIYFIRPGFVDFFKKCLDKFEVGLWTSAQKGNVDELLQDLLDKNGIERRRLKFILTQKDCECIPKEVDDGSGNPNIYLKPLDDVWKKLKGTYDATNTVVVDDSKEKHVRNNKGNYTIVKGYTCEDTTDTYLLGELWPRLEKLEGVSDVRTIVKEWS